MIDPTRLFPTYISRQKEEDHLRQLADQVHQDLQSRAAVLLGPGGAGKTFLVRHLAESTSTGSLVWSEPIDVDDTEYWLLPNLERRIAEDLGQKLPTAGDYFKEYLEYSSQIPRFVQAQLGHETVLAHLRRGEEVFRKCYRRFITETKQTPVVTLDTVEAIRGTDMLFSLTQWMKRLPGTLFVLAGRPMLEHDGQDPFIREFEDSYQPLAYECIELSGFTWEETLGYLERNGVAAALSEPEKEKLALLSQGHPLWLALTLDYLVWEGMPQEAKKYSVAELQALLPFQGGLSEEGRRLHEAFVRRLVVPFRETDFWHEAIKRLAVVRQRVSPEIWQKLMADRSLPKEVGSWEVAWQRLLQIPWVRPRANRRYITLHDALAEELARRIIPLHDREEVWRHQQWRAATKIYRELVENLKRELTDRQATLDHALRPDLSKKRQRQLVRQVAQLDTQKRELDQLTSAWFYYQLLCDFEEGCQQFIRLFDEATDSHDFRFRELLWLEMQVFLPGEAIAPGLLEDVIRPVVERFHTWLATQPDLDYEIGWRGSRHLIDNGRPTEAAEKLGDLLRKSAGNPEREFQLLILSGNAHMRIPGKVKDAELDFRHALERTYYPDSSEKLKNLQGEAHKELGFYFRQTGKWKEAGDTYLEALRITPLRDIVERASIQSNWAYVLALQGGYHEAMNLVETALTVRRRQDLRKGVGMALSVKGEIFRYWREFPEAWEAYQEADVIFDELADWPWLGLIRQEQAICLYQAAQAKELLANYQTTDEMEQQAESLAIQALDLCRDLSIRAYPSALNRAGRIFGHIDPKRGFEFLERGIKWAEEVADGWFWFANLIEYVELRYQTWVNTNDQTHLDHIDERAPEIERVKKDYDFSDLAGRWELLQGHMKMHDALDTGDDEKLEQALEHYKKGFPLIAKGYVGSHGLSAIADEFKKFGQLVTQLLPETQKNWCENMQQAWSDPKLNYIANIEQSTILLGWITEISLESMDKTDEGKVTSI
jgi:tetratricopeptide (TPR) repeat protein